MQAVFLTKRGPTVARGIIVFALGWAGSDEMVRHLAVPEGMDFVALFDYRETGVPEGLKEDISAYKEKYLVGWSFGVWVAGEVFGFAKNLAWAGACAVNGTPRPIDDRYGIPERAFALTVRGIEAAGTKKFLERMCGDQERFGYYLRYKSTRGLEEIVEELKKLEGGYAAASNGQPGFSWTRAVVGMRDAIFPPENMLKYWEETGVEVERVEDMPHYPLYDMQLLARLFPDSRLGNERDA